MGGETLGSSTGWLAAGCAGEDGSGRWDGFALSLLASRRVCGVERWWPFPGEMREENDAMPHTAHTFLCSSLHPVINLM